MREALVVLMQGKQLLGMPHVRRDVTTTTNALVDPTRLFTIA